VDYGELLREALGDPDSAFEHALDTKDPTAVALVSIASPGTAPDRGVARFRALASRGDDATTAELLLGILEHAEACRKSWQGPPIPFCGSVRGW